MITIDQVAWARKGKECETEDDFKSVGLKMFGGCQGCGASIVCYNAFPSKTGFWQCGDCITEDLSFKSVIEFETFVDQFKNANNGRVDDESL